MRIEITDRAISKDQANIEAHQRAAPSEHEAHESADVAILLHPIPVVDPDKREVLHVMENFKQRNADQDICDKVIAVPPKRDARNKQSQLHSIGPVHEDPHPCEVQYKKDRNYDGRQKNQLLPVMNY